MSTEPTPAALAEYDQVHANTTAYLGVLVGTLRDLVAQGIARPDAVVALYGQLLDPHPDTDPAGRFDHDQVTQLLAIAVDRLEPGWPA
jgi:hypothetical protein